MEKVFSKTIPSLIENVNTLDTITQRIKNTEEKKLKTNKTTTKNKPRI